MFLMLVCYKKKFLALNLDLNLILKIDPKMCTFKNLEENQKTWKKFHKNKWQPWLYIFTKKVILKVVHKCKKFSNKNFLCVIFLFFYFVLWPPKVKLVLHSIKKRFWDMFNFRWARNKLAKNKRFIQLKWNFIPYIL